jgi:hypothetical protein
LKGGDFHASRKKESYKKSSKENSKKSKKEIVFFNTLP